MTGRLQKVYEDIRNIVRKKYKSIPLQEVYAKSEIVFDNNPDYVEKMTEIWKPVFYPDDERRLTRHL
jgi:hypothetical protein